MSRNPSTSPILAYETQVRYALDDGWVTIDVSRSRLTALEDAVFRPDPWGRTPTDIRIREVTGWRKAA